MIGGKLCRIASRLALPHNPQLLEMVPKRFAESNCTRTPRARSTITAFSLGRNAHNLIALAGLDAETGVVMLLYLDLAYNEWLTSARFRNDTDCAMPFITAP